MGLAMAFFGVWIGGLVLMKTLLLQEYHVDFVGWSKILVGALILSKVALILEHVSLGAWVRARPAWVDVVVRTALYAAGVVVVLALEHGLKERRAAGGFVSAITTGLKETNSSHLLVNAICLSGALLVYNALAVVRSHLGPGGLLRFFMTPIPLEPNGGKSTTPGSSKREGRETETNNEKGPQEAIT